VFRRAPVERVNRHSQMTGFPSSIVRPSGFVENVAAGGPPRGVGVTSVEADAFALDPRITGV